MKLIIAGSRHLNLRDKKLNLEIGKALWELNMHGGHPHPQGDVPPTVTQVVSGTANGADEYGEQWASVQQIGITRFAPDWDRYGRAAGPIRNKQMAEYADQLFLIWDGKSRGSASMKRLMLAENKPVHEFILGDTDDQ